MEIAWRTRLSSVLCSITVLAAWLLATPATTFAAETCPASSTSPIIDEWKEVYRNRGVTLCKGVEYTIVGERLRAYVQIVDFNEGAKMRIMSEVAPPSTPGNPATTFRVRTAADWYPWVKLNVSTPNPSLVFSTTNASFHVNPDVDTPLSLPHKKWNQVLSTGWALTHPGDVAWLAPKRKFGLGHPSNTPQTAYMAPFPSAPPANTTYTLTDVLNGLNGYWDGIVGVDPQHEFVPGQKARRTMLGLRDLSGCWGCPQDRAYILTTAATFTVPDARDILATDFNTMWNIQLDGGNSTQLESAYGTITSGLCYINCRAVPDVLVVYLAP
jgi:hypothetical protein